MKFKEFLRKQIRNSPSVKFARAKIAQGVALRNAAVRKAVDTLLAIEPLTSTQNALAGMVAVTLFVFAIVVNFAS